MLAPCKIGNPTFANRISSKRVVCYLIQIQATTCKLIISYINWFKDIFSDFMNEQKKEIHISLYNFLQSASSITANG